MQFFIRDNRLHGLAYMRSNDAILGLPYDIFLFTMLQETMAATLVVELGEYHHYAGSLHLYSHHHTMAKEIVRNRVESEFEMPPMIAVEEIPYFWNRSD
jgi:thymidylate synthase